MRYVLIDEYRRQNCIDHILQLDVKGKKKYSVEVTEYVKNRTSEQNRAYWGVWLAHLAEGTDYPAKAWHEYFKKNFLPVDIYEINGMVVEDKPSTKKLTTKQFSEYIEHIYKHCAEEFGIYLPEIDNVPEWMYER